MKRTPALAVVVDIVLVVIFCAIGRRSHDETGAIAGLATTAWPFLLGGAIGWGATIALYRNKFDAFSIVPTGLLVWLGALVFGMIFRVVSGQGIAFSFVIVAAIVLALFLIGWRALANAIGRRATRPGRGR